jgi:hypothetical protein
LIPQADIGIFLILGHWDFVSDFEDIQELNLSTNPFAKEINLFRNSAFSPRTQTFGCFA